MTKGNKKDKKDKKDDDVPHINSRLLRPRGQNCPEEEEKEPGPDQIHETRPTRVWRHQDLKTEDAVMEYLTCWTESRNLLHPPDAADQHRRLIIRSRNGNSLCRLCGWQLRRTMADCPSCL